MKKTIEIFVIYLNKLVWANPKERKASKKVMGVPNIYGTQTSRGYLEL